MSWTYDFTKFADATPSSVYPPATLGQRYQIRLWLQDTDTTRQLFQDEEIDWQVTISANQYLAAASLCDVLVGRARGIRTKKVGDLSLAYDPEFYRVLAGSLRARGSLHQIPYVGGISIADKEAQQNDPDWVAPRIAITTFDNPRAEQPGPSDQTNANAFPTGT